MFGSDGSFEKTGGLLQRSMLIIVVLLLPSLLALKYPNEIVDTPIVICEADKIIIKVRM